MENIEKKINIIENKIIELDQLINLYNNKKNKTIVIISDTDK
jgi:hypothetical protein